MFLPCVTFFFSFAFLSVSENICIGLNIFLRHFLSQFHIFLLSLILYLFFSCNISFSVSCFSPSAKMECSVFLFSFSYFISFFSFTNPRHRFSIQFFLHQSESRLPENITIFFFYLHSRPRLILKQLIVQFHSFSFTVSVSQSSFVSSFSESPFVRFCFFSCPHSVFVYSFTFQELIKVVCICPFLVLFRNAHGHCTREKKEKKEISLDTS